MRRAIIGLLAMALATTVHAQHHHGAHVHGEAELRLALEGNTLVLEFESPMDNLVGFEHAPRNQKQRDALAATEQTLSRWERLFALPSAAACTLKDVQLQSPWPRAGQDKDHAEHQHDHADMRATYQFECSQPQALTTVEIKLFDTFPRIHSILAATVGPRGQGAVRLRPAKRVLDL